SSNRGNGVTIINVGTTGNVVQGNYIGTDATGATALGNGGGGAVYDGANNTPIAGNGISARSVDGIYLPDATTGTLIAGTFIGTDTTGTVALGNGVGVLLTQGASGNTIGGTTAASRNIISGNRSDGVLLTGSHTTDNVVEGNLIGTDISG